MKTSSALSFLDLSRYRWLPHLLIAMTVLAVLAGIGLIRFVEYRFVEATGGELTLAAAEIAEKLDRMLFERQGDALMMARALASRTSDPSYLSEYLKWMKKEYSPAYQSLAVMNVQGTVVAATEPSLVGRDYSRAVSFIAAHATRRFDVADVEGQEAESGVDTIAFTTPILDSHGTFLGAVTSRVGVPFLEEVSTRTIRSLEARPGASGRVEYQILTRQGRVFVDSDLSPGGHQSQRARTPFGAAERGWCTGVYRGRACAPACPGGDWLRADQKLWRICRAGLVGPGANGSTGDPGAYSCLLVESRDHRRGGLDSLDGIVVLGHGTFAHRTSAGSTGKCLGESR